MTQQTLNTTVAEIGVRLVTATALREVAQGFEMVSLEMRALRGLVETFSDQNTQAPPAADGSTDPHTDPRGIIDYLKPACDRINQQLAIIGRSPALRDEPELGVRGLNRSVEAMVKPAMQQFEETGRHITRAARNLANDERLSTRTRNTTILACAVIALLTVVMGAWPHSQQAEKPADSVILEGLPKPKLPPIPDGQTIQLPEPR